MKPKSSDRFKFEICENWGRYYSGQLKWKIVDKNTLLWWRVFSHIKNMIFPLWLPSYFSMLTSITCLFQIWSSKLSMAIISKVMMNLSSKFGKFKADNIVVIWSENIVTKNTKDWWRFFSHIKNMIFHPKTWKIPNLQKCYQNGSKPII